MTETNLRLSWASGFGALPLGLLVAVSGCFYSFDNPVEKETPGSVGGAVQLQNAVAGQTLQGGHVTVPWTNGLDLTLDTGGKFLFQDLPDGVYSLSINIPPLAANDYPLLLLRTGISVPAVEGTVDALNIGTLQIPASGLVGGTVSPPAGGIVVASFVPTTENIDAGLGAYEGFSTTTDSSGHYQIRLPAGQHVVAASDEFDSALGTAIIQPAATQSLDLALTETHLTGVIYGELVGTGFGASSTSNPFPSLVTYVATAGGVVLSDAGLIPTPDQNPTQGGSQFNVTVQGGDFVTLTLVPPPSASPNPCDSFLPFSLPAVPVIAGYDTNLGQVTWLSEAALGANGIGPCAPKDGGVSTGTTTGGTGGSGTTSGAGTGGGPTWLDAGFIAFDGGTIQQTAVFPFSPDGGRLVAWMGGASGQTNLYYATSANGYTPAALTIGGNVTPGTLSGAPLLDGVLLSYATFDITDTTAFQFISSVNGPQQAVVPNLGYNPLAALGQETSTFAGRFNNQDGVFVLQIEDVDAGITGAFTLDGTSVLSTFTLSPETTAPIALLTFVATRCAVSDLSGEDGFCLAGNGVVEDPDAGPQTVTFISSVETSGGNPLIQNTQILATGANAQPPVYMGIATLPGQIAVTAGPFGQVVTYWQLSSLATPPGPGFPNVPPETTTLINWNDNILALSFAFFQGTAGIFLPDGGEPAPPPSLQGVVNGQVTNTPSAFWEPSTDSIITSGVPLDDQGNLTVWQLPNQGGD